MCPEFLVAWFHTHPNTAAEGYITGPSAGDIEVGGMRKPKCLGLSGNTSVHLMQHFDAMTRLFSALVFMLTFVISGCNDGNSDQTNKKTKDMDKKNDNETCVKIARQHMLMIKHEGIAENQFAFVYRGIEKSSDLHIVDVISEEDRKNPKPGGDGRSRRIFIDMKTGRVEKVMRTQ